MVIKSFPNIGNNIQNLITLGQRLNEPTGQMEYTDII